MRDIIRIVFRFFFDKLTENKNLLYVIVPFNIGDVICNACFSYYAQQRKKKLATVLVLKERMKGLELKYPHIAGIIYLPDFEMDLVSRYMTEVVNYETDNAFYGHFKIIQSTMIVDFGVPLTDDYKKYCYNLPDEVQFIPPPPQSPLTEVEIANLKAKYFIDKERTIILFPHANSVTFDGHFWKIMVDRLKAKNYKIYCNVASPKETPTQGTEPMITNFRELAWLAENVNCCVGLRSGIFDFLCTTNATKILSVMQFPLFHHDDLKAMFPEKNVQMFFTATEFLRKPMQYFQAQGIEAEINLRHPNIKHAKIYSSDAQMLEDMLKNIY